MVRGHHGPRSAIRFVLHQEPTQAAQRLLVAIYYTTEKTLKPNLEREIMIPALIGAIVGARIGARKARTKRVYAQRFKELWEGIHAISTKMAQGGYSLATQEAAVREMQWMVLECEQIAKNVFNDRETIARVNALRMDIERGAGMISGLQAAAVVDRQTPIAGVN